MRRIAVAVLLISGLLAVSTGQPQSGAFSRIRYTLAMPRPATHLFQVNIALELPPGQNASSLDLQMPRWQPGRYAVANFAANVQEFSAKAGTVSLPFEKADDQTWRIQTQGNRSLSVEYKVFGNDLSGTYAQLDAVHGNYNGGELFMYVVGRKQDPVELEIQPPAGWRVINGRTESVGQTSWKFPNYEILIDNPTEIGSDWTLDEFSSGGKSYRVVIHARNPDDAGRQTLVQNVRRIVDTHVGMWGVPDFERYTFLYHFAGDNRSFDGMEHLTSTQIIHGGASIGDPGVLQSVLESTSHEFFHVWNVKRLRPIELGPWDWTKPANTRSLWIAEGLTEYFGKVLMARSGLWDSSRLFQEIAGSIASIENSPGGRVMSAVDASLAAPFIDTAILRQQTNLSNTTVSYYSKGELVGVVLDLTIRGRTDGRRSLDDVLKQMYDEFYLKAPNASYYLKGRGYTEEDFIRVLSAVAGTNMRGFYDRHIRGVERLPYDEAFAVVGLQLTKTATEAYSSGLALDNSGQARVANLRPDSAAARAGLQLGDVLVSIAGTAATRQNWRTLLDQYKPGDRVRVQAQRFGKTIDVELQLGEPERFNYRLEDLRSVSPDARRLRTGWLSGR